MPKLVDVIEFGTWSPFWRRKTVVELRRLEKQNKELAAILKRWQVDTDAYPADSTLLVDTTKVLDKFNKGI